MCAHTLQRSHVALHKTILTLRFQIRRQAFGSGQVVAGVVSHRDVHFGLWQKVSCFDVEVVQYACRLMGFGL